MNSPQSKNNHKIILAIESAICGGSISLLRDGVEISNWTGSSNVSKAEDLLANIDLLLRNNNVTCRDIGLITVSAGPGSFTGIRIGLATALGFKTGASTKMASESALKSMIVGQEVGKIYTSGLPVGRNVICIQSFRGGELEITPLDQPRTLSEAEFAEFIKDNSESTLVLHGSLFSKFDVPPEHINFGTNMALSIAKLCSRTPDIVAEPLFISKSF